MQVIQGTVELDVSSSDSATDDINLPEFDKNLYKIEAFNMVVVPPDLAAAATYNTVIAACASIAINQRTSLAYTDFYAKDIIARNGKVINAMMGASDTVGSYGIQSYFDDFNLVDPVAPYFNNDLRLLFQNMNANINTGTFEIAWQIMYTVVKKSSNILNDMNERRYTVTGGGG